MILDLNLDFRHRKQTRNSYTTIITRISRAGGDGIATKTDICCDDLMAQSEKDRGKESAQRPSGWIPKDCDGDNENRNIKALKVAFYFPPLNQVIISMARQSI